MTAIYMFEFKYIILYNIGHRVFESQHNYTNYIHIGLVLTILYADIHRRLSVYITLCSRVYHKKVTPTDESHRSALNRFTTQKAIDIQSVVSPSSFQHDADLREAPAAENNIYYNNTYIHHGNIYYIYML